MSETDKHEIAGFHLNHKQLNALTRVFAHPVSHDMSWHDVRTLLDAVGEVDEQHNGSWKITIAGQAEVFDPNHGKDLTVQQVIDLRHMLTAAGLEPGA
jgi:hypothetical protein